MNIYAPDLDIYAALKKMRNYIYDNVYTFITIV